MKNPAIKKIVFSETEAEAIKRSNAARITKIEKRLAWVRIQIENKKIDRLLGLV